MVTKLSEALQQLAGIRTLLEQMRDAEIARYEAMSRQPEFLAVTAAALRIKQATTNAVKFALIDAVNLTAQVQKRLDIVCSGGQKRIVKTAAPRKWNDRQIDVPVTYISPNSIPGLGQAPRLVAPEPTKRRRKRKRSPHV